MVSGATTDHAAHVEQVKLVARFYGSRDIADKSFQRTTSTEHADQQIARIDLRETSGRQFEHVVSGAVSHRPHDNHVARFRR